MVGVYSGFDDQVVHVYLEHISDLVAEDIVHHSLVCCSCVFQTEGHYVVVIVSWAGPESSAVFVAHCHWDFVIARIGIHER